MLNKPFDSALERALLPSLNLGIRQVTTNSKAMSAPFEIFPLVSWGELSITKNLVSLGLSFEREHLIHRASVKEKWSLRVGEIFLTMRMAI
jgi:hypothetical protein